MKLKSLLVIGAALALGSPLFATTYLGAFEDYSGSQSDYDYNDLVFSLSGSSLSLHTATGQWITAPSVASLNMLSGAHGLTGTPFWNNSSLDGAGGYSVGSCIYGGGKCNGGVGLAPGANYLATSTGKSVNDVYFSTDSSVSASVAISITAGNDSLGWELVSGVGGAHYFANGVSGLVNFNPGGDFYLVAKNSTTNGSFSSNLASSDGVSHMAFFTPTPEPSSLGLIGLGLVGAGTIYRRKKA